MDIISKVSQKAEEAFQTIKNADATKKAMNYAEIPGLQIQIGKSEAAIKKAYEAIGKAYYNEKEGDTVEEINFEEQFAIIKENKEKIVKLKEDIDNIRKKPEADAADDVVNTQEAKTVETKVCPICNHSVPADSAFCSVCGHQFKED